MNYPPHPVLFAAELSDEAAYQILDFLQALTTEFENHYAAQIRRYCEPSPPSQEDLFDDPWDDENPPF